MAVKLLFLARTPILARLLSPDDFGLLAIGLVALDILMRITELGMIPALVQKDRPERLHSIAAS
jgi:PST family polysaccharide transporter